MKNSELRAISKKYADKINQYVDDWELNNSEISDVITISESKSKKYPSGQKVDVSFKINTEGDGLPNDFDMSDFSSRTIDLKDKNLSAIIEEYQEAIR